MHPFLPPLPPCPRPLSLSSVVVKIQSYLPHTLIAPVKLLLTLPHPSITSCLRPVFEARSNQNQYPYLIRAITWASQLGLTVIIDLHGAPGSQNGQDNSGLIGPVEFQANSTNSDRSLNVLRNLTDEFGREDYGGVVVGEFLLFRGLRVRDLYRF